MRLHKRFILLLLLVNLNACAMGFLYTHTTEPFTTDFNKTPVSDLGAKNDSKNLSYSEIQVSWDDNGIGVIADENGFYEIYFADLEVFSLFGGLWSQEYLHVYGSRIKETESAQKLPNSEEEK